MKARLWVEDREIRAVNTGDGFVTISKGNVGLIVIARPNERVLSLMQQIIDASEPLEVEDK
jgi:hypothetical protein